MASGTQKSRTSQHEQRPPPLNADAPEFFDAQKAAIAPSVEA